MSKKITIDIDAYDSKLKGRPWIAHVTFDGRRPIFNFGDSLGDPGGAFILSLINIVPGDIVAKGQKDLESGKSNTEYYIVGSTYQLMGPITKSDAYSYYYTHRN